MRYMETTQAPSVASLGVTVEEAGIMLGVSRASMYRAIKARQVPAYRIGRQWRMSRKWVEDFVAGRVEGF